MEKNCILDFNKIIIQEIFLFYLNQDDDIQEMGIFF